MIIQKDNAVKKVYAYANTGFDFEHGQVTLRVAQETYVSEDGGATWGKESTDSELIHLGISDHALIDPATLKLYIPPATPDVGEVAPVPEPPSNFVPAFTFLTSVSDATLREMMGLEPGANYILKDAVAVLVERFILVNPEMFKIVGVSTFAV